MALPLASAGLRVAMAIAKRAGKKLVKTSSYGGKGKYKYATAKRSLYKAHKITSKKRMGMYTGYYYDRLSGQRSKRLKRTAIGGLIGYKVFGNGD